MINLDGIQQERDEWSERNFPSEGHKLDLAHNTLGVCEEAGELAHHVLKMQQGIRGTKEEHLAQVQDAVGDTVIYLLGVCSKLGLSLEDCIRETWAQVRQRDWQKNKIDGGDPSVGETATDWRSNPTSPLYDPDA